MAQVVGFYLQSYCLGIVQVMWFRSLLGVAIYMKDESFVIICNNRIVNDIPIKLHFPFQNIIILYSMP